MDLERERRVLQILEQALDLAGEKRENFLRSLEHTDATFAEDVRARLAVGGSDFLEHPFLEPEGDLSETLRDYQLIKEIGHGGMGTVYLAEHPYLHRVAVKILRRGLDTDQFIARFHNERDILGNLVHPFIARLLDGGTTSDGRPYLVMEYVDGLPFLTYCEQEQLSIRERLRLFRKVCEAVQFAHQNLVIHRDLKPGNILVTADGTPKLLDFGIAKLVPNADDQQTELNPMTPEYASPEQLRGLLLTTATDVFSLGELLYQVLTGQHPFHGTPRGGTDWVDAVCHQEPTGPSRVSNEWTRPGRWGNALSNDLDTIVLKAMRKEASERYRSPRHLADDLERHLHGFPIEARPATLVYRVRKLVQRNRLASATLALASLALLTITAILAVQTQRLAIQRDRAERALSEARTAREEALLITDYMVSIFDVADPTGPGVNDISARDLLKQGAVEIRYQLQDTPVVRAGLLNALGKASLNLSSMDQAESFLAEAKALFHDEVGSLHPKTASAELNYADLLIRSSRFDEAEESLEHAARATASAGGSEPFLEAMIEASRGYLAFYRGEYRSAIHHMEEADLCLQAIDPPRPHEHADLLSDMGIVLRSAGEYQRAEDTFRIALANLERVYGSDHVNLSDGLLGIGRVFVEKGEMKKAEPLYLEALALRIDALGDDHFKVGLALNNLGGLYFRLSQWERSEMLFRQALPIFVAVYGSENPYTAFTYNNLGNALVNQGIYEEAHEMLSKALAIRDQAYAANHPMTLSTRQNLGNAALRLGRYNEAISLLENSVDGWRQRGTLTPEMARAVNNLGFAYFRLGRVEEGQLQFQEAIEIWDQIFPEGHWDKAVPLQGLARLFAETGKREKAIASMEDVMAIWDRHAPPNHEGFERLHRLLAILKSGKSFDWDNPEVSQ